MAFIRLNHAKVREEMARLFMRPVDLARKLGVNRQTANYIIHRGGVIYSSRLAKIFGHRETYFLCTELKMPEGMSIVNNKVRKGGD